ncbi:flagellar protein FlaG [Clostridium sp. JS66]|uniref:flagellar protein FlaG n=1 Tax=Clostridium sp. JS66 TaxID=3064705 RepID=UPI00298E7A4A|nr:flagellar protein FlaG [Clostridium sp. JS66]WPC41079.1 flagellar protein FlaG [Clostridium sp. JS66]
MEVNVLSQGGQNIITANPSTQYLNDNVKVENRDNISQVNVVEKVSETKETRINEEKVKKSVERLNKLLEDRETHVEYELIGKTKQIGIKIVNNETKEVIKEVPPKKFVEMMDKLCELAGVMIDERG